MQQMLCPVLVGRDAELAAISQALDGLAGGRGASLMLVGEAGIGKTRLARAARELCGERSIRVLWGRGSEQGTAVPYRPLAEALHSAIREAGLPETAELAPFRPILGRIVPAWREAAGSAPEESPALFGEGVLRLLRALGGDAGCLVVLEDLHWADSETLAVVDYLAANIAGERLVLLATTRREEDSGAVALARSFMAHRVGRVLELPRLAAPDVASLASACLDGQALPEPIGQVLHAAAEGLPLVVEDLLAEWAGTGALVREDSGWKARQLPAPVVPLTFGDTVRRRAHALGLEGAQLLRAAAMLGRRFDWTILPAATSLDEERVLELLRQAVAGQLLLADTAGFLFRHALTQAAVLEELLPPERQRLAARLLGIVQAVHPQLDGDCLELAAGLAEAAGNAGQAADLLLQSGRRSHAAGALATAEATLERARRLAAGEPGLEFDAGEELLGTLADAGKYEGVLGLGAELLRQLEGAPAMPEAPGMPGLEEGGTVRRAGIHLCIARAACAAAAWDTAGRHLEEARRLAAGDVPLRARIDALVATAALGGQCVEDAERSAQAALAAAEQHDLPDVACEALQVIGRCERRLDIDRAEAAFARALAIAERHRLTVQRISALHELGTIEMFRDFTGERLLQARDLAERSGALAKTADIDFEIAAVHSMRAEHEECLAWAQRSAEAAHRFGLSMTEGVALAFQAQVHALRGERALMEARIDDVERLTNGHPVLLYICWGDARAIASLVEEDRSRALTELETCERLARQVTVAGPSPSLGLWALFKTFEQDGGADACRRVESSWAMVQPINVLQLRHAEAVELGRAGRGGEAAAIVAAARSTPAARSWWAHYALRLAAEAGLADGWGQPAAWLQDCIGFFELHGQAAVASACRSLLRKCGVTPRRAHLGVPEPFRGRGVTEREMEVLALIEDGLTNRDIGQRLYLSPKTVEKHVASLMAKLEAHTRAQLAALAAARARQPTA